MLIGFAPMDRDRSLLLAAFCLQTGMLDPEQFFTACRVCTERPEQTLEDVLAERGWIQPVDRPHLEYLVERYLRAHDNDAKAAMTHLLVAARLSLASLEPFAPESTLAYSPPAADRPQVSGPVVAPAVDARYVFTSVHATGGMGRVWRAR